VATYRLWPATSGGSSAGDFMSVDLGVQFRITQPGCTFTGWYWWVASSGQDTTAGNYAYRLFSTTNGTSGTLIAGPATPSSLTAGAWNFLAASPVALASGSYYVAVVTYDSSGSGYSVGMSYWTTGTVGTSGITQGPLYAPPASLALDGAQGTYNEPSTSPYFPAQGITGTNYWIDVQITQASAGAPAQDAMPGQTWKRHFQHPQQPQPGMVASPAPIVPVPPGDAEPGQTWKRHFQHPQQPAPPPPPPYDPFQYTFTSRFGGPETPVPPLPADAAPGLAWRRHFQHPQQPAPSPPVHASSSDTATGADAGTPPPASLTAADTALGAESSWLSPSSSDSAAGTDATTAQSAGLTSADTASGAESAWLSPSSADSASGADAGPVPPSALAAADYGLGPGYGTNVILAPQFSEPVTDTAGGVLTDTSAVAGETGQIAAASPDTGAGTDAASPPPASLASADTALGSEAWWLRPASADSAAGADSGLPPVVSPDSALGTESWWLSLAFADTAAGADAGLPPHVSLDTASGAESGWLSPSSADSASGTDAGLPPVVSADTASGADGQTSVALASADTASGTDAGLPPHVSPDTASGADGQSSVAVASADSASGAESSWLSPASADTALGTESWSFAGVRIIQMLQGPDTMTQTSQVTIPAGTTAGSTLVVTFEAYTNYATPAIALTSLGDSAGNTWTYSTQPNSQFPPSAGAWYDPGGIYGWTAIAYCQDAQAIAPGGYLTLTLSVVPLGEGDSNIELFELAGMPPGSGPDGYATAAPDVQEYTATTPAILTTGAGDTVFACTANMGVWYDISDGWILFSTNSAYLLDAPPGSQSATFSNSDGDNFLDIPFGIAILALGMPVPALPPPPAAPGPAWLRRFRHPQQAAPPPPAAMPVSGTDSALGTESWWLSPASADTAAGADAGLPPVVSADSALGTESAWLSPSSADTASGTDATAAQSASPASADTALGTESSWMSLASADTASGTDAGLPPHVSADSAAGAESAWLSPSSADSASGTDAGLPPVVSADSGLGTESSWMSLASADSAAGAESGRLGLSSADTASGADTGRPGPLAADSAAGTDAARSGPLAADSAAGTESGRLGLSSADTASGTDGGGLGNSVFSADSGRWQDAEWDYLSAPSDTASGSESWQLSPASADSVLGTDGPASAHSADTAAGTDYGYRAGPLAAADTAAGTEGAAMALVYPAALADTAAGADTIYGDEIFVWPNSVGWGSPGYRYSVTWLREDGTLAELASAPWPARELRALAERLGRFRADGGTLGFPSDSDSAAGTDAVTHAMANLVIIVAASAVVTADVPETGYILSGAYAGLSGG